MEYQLLIGMDWLKNDILVEVIFLVLRRATLFIVRVTAFYKFLVTYDDEIRYYYLEILIEINKFINEFS